MAGSCRTFPITLNQYIYIIIPPNLGLRIAVPGREREQGRFRGSREGPGGAAREQGRAVREQGKQ